MGSAIPSLLLALRLLVVFLRRPPSVIIRCLGALFPITAAVFVGLRAVRHLATFLVIGAAGLHAEVKQVRTYHTHEPNDRNVVFAMAVTSDQDVLSFVGKSDGKWHLTRVRDWLDKSPLEQTIEVPGITAATSLDLRVTPDGRFATCVATILKKVDGQRGGTFDNLVSIVDLRTFQIVSSVHQEGAGEHSVDTTGHLVLEEPVSRGTLARVVRQGEDNKHGYPCGSAGVMRDGLFRLESCQTMGHTFFWEYPTITNRDENIYSTKTGALVGAVKETTHDPVSAGLAEVNGRDYLLVVEGGTQLKVYGITEPHP